MDALQARAATDMAAFDSLPPTLQDVLKDAPLAVPSALVASWVRAQGVDQARARVLWELNRQCGVTRGP